jgi:hypothetical protein
MSQRLFFFKCNEFVKFLRIHEYILQTYLMMAGAYAGTPNYATKQIFINKIVPVEYSSAFDRWDVNTKGRSISAPKYVPVTRCLYINYTRKFFESCQKTL